MSSSYEYPNDTWLYHANASTSSKADDKKQIERLDARYFTKSFDPFVDILDNLELDQSFQNAIPKYDSFDGEGSDDDHAKHASDVMDICTQNGGKIEEQMHIQEQSQGALQRELNIRLYNHSGDFVLGLAHVTEICNSTEDTMKLLTDTQTVVKKSKLGVAVHALEVTVLSLVQQRKRQTYQLLTASHNLHIGETRASKMVKQQAMEQGISELSKLRSWSFHTNRDVQRSIAALKPTYERLKEVDKLLVKSCAEAAENMCVDDHRSHYIINALHSCVKAGLTASAISIFARGIRNWFFAWLKENLALNGLKFNPNSKDHDQLLDFVPLHFLHNVMKYITNGARLMTKALNFLNHSVDVLCVIYSGEPLPTRLHGFITPVEFAQLQPKLMSGEVRKAAKHEFVASATTLSCAYTDQAVDISQCYLNALKGLKKGTKVHTGNLEDFRSLATYVSTWVVAVQELVPKDKTDPAEQHNVQKVVIELASITLSRIKEQAAKQPRGATETVLMAYEGDDFAHLQTPSSLSVVLPPLLLQVPKQQGQDRLGCFQLEDVMKGNWDAQGVLDQWLSTSTVHDCPTVPIEVQDQPIVPDYDTVSEQLQFVFPLQNSALYRWPVPLHWKETPDSKSGPEKCLSNLEIDNARVVCMLADPTAISVSVSCQTIIKTVKDILQTSIDLPQQQHLFISFLHDIVDLYTYTIVTDFVPHHISAFYLKPFAPISYKGIKHSAYEPANSHELPIGSLLSELFTERFVWVKNLLHSVHYSVEQGSFLGGLFNNKSAHYLIADKAAQESGVHMEHKNAPSSTFFDQKTGFFDNLKSKMRNKLNQHEDTVQPQSPAGAKMLQFEPPVFSSGSRRAFLHELLNNEDTYYGLQEYKLAITSLFVLSYVLKFCEMQQQGFLSKDSLLTLRRCAVNTCGVAIDLCRLFPLTVSAHLLPKLNITKLIINQKWKTNDFSHSHHSYVDNIITALAEAKTNLQLQYDNCGTIDVSHSVNVFKVATSTSLRGMFYAICMDLCYELLSAYSQVTSWSAEGRTAAVMDIGMLKNTLQHIFELTPLPRINALDEYISAFYMNEKQYIDWTRKTALALNLSTSMILALAICGPGEKMDRQKKITFSQSIRNICADNTEALNAYDMRYRTSCMQIRAVPISYHNVHTHLQATTVINDEEELP